MFTQERAICGTKLILIGLGLWFGVFGPGQAMAGGLIAYGVGTATAGSRHSFHLTDSIRFRSFVTQVAWRWSFQLRSAGVHPHLNPHRRILRLTARYLARKHGVLHFAIAKLTKRRY